MIIKITRTIFLIILSFGISTQLVRGQLKPRSSLYFSAGTNYNLAYYTYNNSPESPWMAQTKGRLSYHFGPEIHIPVSKSISLRTGVSFYRHFAVFVRDNNNAFPDIPSRVRDTIRWSEFLIPLNILIKTSAKEDALFIGIGPSLAIPFATKRNAYNQRWGFATNYTVEFYFNDTEERKNKPQLGLNLILGKPFNMFRKSFMLDFTAYSDLSSRKLPATYNFEAPETYRFRNYFFSVSLSAYLDFWAKQKKD